MGDALKTEKVSFTMPEDVTRALRACVSKRKRSSFVAEAVAEKLKALEAERLRQELIEGYQARRQEDAETNQEWEAITLEKWPPMNAGPVQHETARRATAGRRYGPIQRRSAVLRLPQPALVRANL